MPPGNTALGKTALPLKRENTRLPVIPAAVSNEPCGLHRQMVETSNELYGLVGAVAGDLSRISRKLDARARHDNLGRWAVGIVVTLIGIATTYVTSIQVAKIGVSANIAGKNGGEDVADKRLRGFEEQLRLEREQQKTQHEELLQRLDKATQRMQRDPDVVTVRKP